jgi:predicted transposase/invertase (TIGR01784 family)
LVSVHAARDVWETAKRDGWNEGRAEGWNVGKIEGWDEGRAEGRAEGILQNKLENAKNLKALGIPAETIAKGVGLTIEEIEKL